MKKYAQLKAMWPLVYQKLKSPPQGLNLGTLPGRLPPMNKIVFDDIVPADNAGAIGYVSTEDTDQNGVIDTMHIVVPNLEKHLQGISPADLQSNDPNKLYSILAPFVELIAHEMGHQKDYQHEHEQPFPGGESVADQAAHQALNEISVQATNKRNKSDILMRRFTMKKELISRLVKLAGDLDAKGAYKLSDEVTTLAEKIAQETDPFVSDFSEAGRRVEKRLNEEMPSDTFVEDFSQAGREVERRMQEGKDQEDPFVRDFSDAGKRIERKLHSVQNAQLYHPGGGMTGERVFTGQVKFDWGTYGGDAGSEPYYIGTGRTELGSVQMAGDPFTYEPVGKGKLRVVSGPEGSRHAIGRVIDDPRTPSVVPSQETAGPRETAPMGVPTSPEYSDPDALQLDIEKGQRVLSQNLKYYEDVLRRHHVPALRIEELTNPTIAIDGYDRRLSEIFDGRVPEEVRQVTDKLKADRMKLREMESRVSRFSPADDGAQEEVDSSLPLEASLEVDELTKNASFNAVFWKQNLKTPFGR